MKYENVKVGMKVRYDDGNVYTVSEIHSRTNEGGRPIRLKETPEKVYNPEWITQVLDDKILKLKEKLLK